MHKEASLWKISELMERVDGIDFPEYQREPTVWTRAAKQRLVDSVARQFDVSAIYLYRHEDGHWDCVDGRQRISAIRSFLGENPDDENDDGFAYRLMNEIYEDETHPYRKLDGKTFSEINTMAGQGDREAAAFKEALENYRMTVVELSETTRPEEFNLQFTRLNLGQLIISGEKLNAMVGELRDICFDGLGKHEFLSGINIPTRRYAREQLAAQIVAQVFEIESSKKDVGTRQFARIRHLDLQSLFKEHSRIDGEKREWVERVTGVMDLLAGELHVLPVLRSRSIVLSLVLLAYEQGIKDENDAHEIAEFASAFVGRLKEQVGRGLDAQVQYRYLIDFQRRLTQASGEKYSVRERAEELESSFRYWRQMGRLKGEEG